MTVEELLLMLAKKQFEREKAEVIPLVVGEEANRLYNDIEGYPHLFVLACFMDRQMNADKAWVIPYEIGKTLGSFEFNAFSEVSLSTYKQMFAKNNLHRFNETMAEVFYKAVKRIEKEYEGDASKIWSGNPNSAEVVYRFLQFEGVGIKIATMATNMLARLFKIPFADYSAIDVSPDVHVKRVMHRLGLVKADPSNEDVIYKARSLNPEFPGIIDEMLWYLGRQFCTAEAKKCDKCFMQGQCPKND